MRFFVVFYFARQERMCKSNNVNGKSGRKLRISSHTHVGNFCYRWQCILLTNKIIFQGVIILKKRKNRIPKEYLEFDNIADGIFVSPKNSCPNLDMQALMAYCNKNGIRPSQLSKEELLKFNKE